MESEGKGLKRIRYSDINRLAVNNLVQFNGSVFSIYDMEDDLVYLNNSDLNRIGIPYTEIRPILLSEHVMNACSFTLRDKPSTVYVGEDLIEARMDYVLRHDKLDVDFAVSIVKTYYEDDLLLVKTVAELNDENRRIMYLHQVQNIFRMTYGFELLRLE
jgi:hypothetical protein